jgi:uncharacterized protein (DUF736 family)
MKRKMVLLAVAALVAALTAVAALSATPSVTITSPTSNQKISLHRNPQLTVTGTAAFADASAGTTEFFLRRDGCGTSADNPHMSITSGTDAGDGCGLIIDAVGPVGDVAPQASFTDYPAVDGMPLSYDGTQPINGQISLSGAQVGLAEVDVDLQALVGGQAVDIGTATGSAVLDPTGNSTPVPFTIQPNVALDGSDIQALDLRVTTHGPNVYSGFVALSGASWVKIPSHASSVNKAVEISVDDPSFSNPIAATLSGSTWSASIPTPAVGKHTIYAESAQGYTTSAPASVTISVTK